MTGCCSKHPPLHQMGSEVRLWKADLLRVIRQHGSHPRVIEGRLQRNVQSGDALARARRQGRIYGDVARRPDEADRAGLVFGFFSPVRSLLRTSRLTSAASRPSCFSTNFATAAASRTESARSAHDIAFVTISSRSSNSSSHTANVRATSPVPPCERTFKGIVLTSAARRARE